MDGTLTLPVHDFNAIRRELGIVADTPILEAIKEMPLDQGKRVSRELHRLEMDLAALAEPQPGARDILFALQQKGCQLGILTRNGEDIAMETLKACGLLEFFNESDVIGRDTCAPKPSPEGVNYLLNKWQADKHSSVMVGDFLYDIEAGFHAGVHTIHFDKDGEFAWPEFTGYEVTAIANIQNLFE